MKQKPTKEMEQRFAPLREWAYESDNHSLIILADDKDNFHCCLKGSFQNVVTCLANALEKDEDLYKAAGLAIMAVALKRQEKKSKNNDAE